MRIKLSIAKLFTYIKVNYFNKILKKRNGLKFNKHNLNSWMNLTKKERFNLYKRDSMIYSIDRKNLLKQIRNEYKKNIEKD